LRTPCKSFSHSVQFKRRNKKEDADIRYTRLMASYNPAMLSDGALPKDWKAAPDLTSFAASYSSNTTASISAPTAGTGSDSGSSSDTPPSADPSTAAGLAATGNGASTSD